MDRLVQQIVTDDLDALIAVLPPHIQQALKSQNDNSELLEIVLDLGRPSEARYPNREIVLSQNEITSSDIEYVVARIGQFSGDNRAGIERTLHRISAIRNREGSIVGLTSRVGRAVYGTVKIIQDFVESGNNVLLLGRPGVGKTTMLREVARVLADDFRKRVMIVDTSNEIAGDGDIPHPAIGHARRMQVQSPMLQHAVMIEAVENHMPEVIIVDEIGTSLEAEAARTIAERGVQLVGTAHGNSLENLMMNPTLSDLIGGIQTVTLGDEEARRRNTQKSILERKAPPTFLIVVEIQERDRVVIHPNVAEAVDAILHNREQETEIRWIDERGEIRISRIETSHHSSAKKRDNSDVKLYLFGVNRHKLEDVARERHVELNITNRLSDANIFLTTKNYYRRKPQKIRDAELASIPIYAVKSSNIPQLRQCLDSIFLTQKNIATIPAIDEIQMDTADIKEGSGPTVLNPQNAFIRRLQHIIAKRHELISQSHGRKTRRKVIFSNR